MIARATALPISSRLTAAELRGSEVRTEHAQGPVPECLRTGYQTPPAVVRLPDLPLPAAASCASSAPSIVMRKTAPGTPKLPPAAEAAPLPDPAARRALVAEQLPAGVWRTAWEIAQATGLHPEVVRTTLHSLRARSRPVAEEDIKARGALIEYAAMKEGTAAAEEPTARTPRRFAYALCEVCERATAYREVPIDGGADLVCAECGTLIATLCTRNPGPRPEKET